MHAADNCHGIGFGAVHIAGTQRGREESLPTVFEAHLKRELTVFKESTRYPILKVL